MTLFFKKSLKKLANKEKKNLISILLLIKLNKIKFCLINQNIILTSVY